MKKKLCIFDLDGTLLDSIDDIANSMNRVLRASGYPEYSIDWYKHMAGRGARNLLTDVLSNQPAVSEEKFEDILRIFCKDLKENSAVLTKPFDGIFELLDCLAEYSIQTAIISNKPDAAVREVAERYFENYSFAAIYGELAGIPTKPDPQIAQKLLSQLGILADEAVYIGDTEIDMQFAANAGLFGIGVLWGFREREVLVEYGARAIVDLPKQILEYL